MLPAYGEFRVRSRRSRLQTHTSPTRSRIQPWRSGRTYANGRTGIAPAIAGASFLREVIIAAFEGSPGTSLVRG